MKIKHIVAAGIACAALITSSSSRADMVTDWNETAEAVIRASTPSPPLQIRALAIVNAAIYDAVNGIARNYQPYFVTDTAPAGPRHETADAQARRAARRRAPEGRPLPRRPHSRHSASYPLRSLVCLKPSWLNRSRALQATRV